MRIYTGLMTVAGAAALWSAPAAAQATRTWVSGVGDDVNPCSRTAPCKTFAGAISKTAAGGEINCIDPGGFGAVTITKSMTISCDGLIGSVLAPGATGINVNAGENDRVVLSGLDIHGGGSGAAGIRVLKARSVIVRNVTVQGFNAANGRGIANEGGQQMIVMRSTVIHNTTGLSGTLTSTGDNLVAGNGTDGSFASTVRLK
jgi:hypothetical protein